MQFHPEADALTDAAFAAYFNTLSEIRSLMQEKITPPPIGRRGIFFDTAKTGAALNWGPLPSVLQVVLKEIPGIAPEDALHTLR